MTDCPDIGNPIGFAEDALARPTGDALLEPTLALLPRGAAWRTDEMADADHASFLHRFWRAVCEPLSDLYKAMWETALQGTSSTVTWSLDDWEIDYGLPESCGTTTDDPALRLRELRWKIAVEPSASIDHFICLAAHWGYDVWIEEIHWFEFGRSSFDGGDPPGGLVEGGHRPDALGPSTYPTRPPKWWTVHIRGQTAPVYFEFGYSAFGQRLLDFNEATDLECAIRRDAPAHTIPLFDYGG